MIDQIIAGYEVLNKLGAGGMGVVYRARHSRLERLVALKLLPPEQVVDESRRRRFLQEARAASALNHPGIVTIHDVVDHDGADVLVMELVEGEALDQRIPPGGLPWREAAEFALELSEAMAAAHEAGIVHRDLKPANVMVTSGGRIKVLDFGIAKLMPGGEGHRGTSGVETATPAITEFGVQPGTPAYMAPEQLLGEPVDRRVDIFAFGSLVYEMLTGQRPFRGHNPIALLDEILHGDPQPVRKLRLKVPVAFAALVEKALAKQPAKRHQSMGEIGAELRSLLAPGPVVEQGETAEGVTLKALVASDLVESTLLAEVPGGEGFGLEDLGRLLQDLVEKHRGQEVRTESGRLLLFELPWDAVRFALAFHQALEQQGQKTGTEFETRVGIHLGEVTIGRVEPALAERGDGDPGTWTFDVENQAQATAVRLLSLASPRQTLLTHAAFDLARRGAVRQDRQSDDSGTEALGTEALGTEALGTEALSWLAHGDYLFPGTEAFEVFEVGARGFAPLNPPVASGVVTRSPTQSKILGWRPAPSLSIPQRPNWVVERKLGEGGFGEVWLASQAKTHERRVFKFCYEAARLRSLQREITVFRLLKEELGERDDIARLLDWNLEEAPYFIESVYTEGGSLVDWSAAHGGIQGVDLGERLELLAQVATALEAAHSVGVLHKDVKPANVLITEGPGGQPRALLTDFGIGQIIDPERLLARGITVLGLTEASDESAGTPGTHLYRAPELLTGRGPTIQSDLYALGVMLYQVVVGDLERPLAAGWERDIDDELLREDIAAYADGRPRHRPRSALEVAERLRMLEVRRAAREADRRARKEALRAARRRRLLATAAAVSTVFLLVVSFLALQAERARADAERGRAQAEQLIDVLLGDLHESLEKIGRLDLLEQAARGSQAYFDSLEEREEPSTVTFKRGITLLNIGDVLLGQGDTAAARASFEAARELFESSVARDPASYPLRDGLRRSRLRQAQVLSRQGETALAGESLRTALDEAERLAGLVPQDFERRFAVAECHYEICLLEERIGKYTTALPACRGALRISKERPRQHPEASWRQALLELDSQVMIGALLRREKQGDAALEEFRQARLLAERLAREEPGNTIWPRKLAWIHLQTGHLELYHVVDPDAALATFTAARIAYEELIVVDPTQRRWRSNLADTLSFIGRIHLERRDPRTAMQHFEEAAALLEALIAEDPSQRSLLSRLARIYLKIGRVQLQVDDTTAALESVTAAVELNRQRVEVTSEDPDPLNSLSWSHVVLGEVYALKGEEERARLEWTRAAEMIAPVVGRSDAIKYRDTYAQALLKLGQLTEARPLVEGLLANGWDDPSFIQAVRDAGLGSLVP